MPPKHVNIIIVTACFSLLCYVVQRRTKTALMVGDAIAMIDAYYVDPVDKDQLVVSALNGMTESLDDHSEFIGEQNYQAFQDSIQQEFAGIGIYVEQPEPNQPVRVITPLVGSPALEAGLLPDDRILSINNEEVSSLPLAEVSQRLKGPIGTEITIRIQRASQTVDIQVKRARIELESVIGDHRNQDNGWVYRLAKRPEVAYLRLTSFGDRTVEETRNALASLGQDYNGLILDLRGNGGGLLHAAVEISDMFLSSGRIVSTRTRGGILEDQFDATEGTLVDPSIPIAILIDQDSASASEIVAACMQDHDRAIIVGKRSFGKGTVQNILPLQYGRSALRLTVARYYRPNGENIHRKRDAKEDERWGVLPNSGYEVTLDASKIEALTRRWRESSYPSLSPSADGITKGAEHNDSNNANQDSSPASVDESDRLDNQLWAAVGALKLD